MFQVGTVGREQLKSNGAKKAGTCLTAVIVASVERATHNTIKKIHLLYIQLRHIGEH